MRVFLYLLIIIVSCRGSFAQNLPYLPPELEAAWKPGLPVKLPPPVSSGQFRKLPAGKGFVWIAESSEALAKGNRLAFFMNFDQPIEEDEVALVAIRARTVRSAGKLAKEPRPGEVRIHIAQRDNMRQTALYHAAKIGREWGWYFHPFRAGKPIAKDRGKVRFSFDLQKQAIEIEEVRLYVAPKGFDMARLPMMSLGYQGREADASWRKAADERIQKHRTGRLSLRVVDAAGKAVPNTKVNVKMSRHAFGFGSTFNPKYVLDDNEDAIRYRRTFEELFSALVPSPILIPRHTPNMHGGNYGKKRQRGLELLLKWATDRHLPMRGHTLVWGNLKPWSEELHQAGKPEEIRKYIWAHHDYVLAQTRHTIHEWDAINHPLRFQKDLRDVFDKDIYRDIIARQRELTDAKLIINEALFDNAREDAYFNFMTELQKSPRSKADGIGFQSHFTVQNIRGMEDLWRRYERFGNLADCMVVTEYDLVCNDDQLHADYLRDLLTLTFSHPKMTGFINWGFWAGAHWKPEGALIRKDWTERPAVKVWRDLVKRKWWTTADIKTDAQGLASVKGAFYGRYEIKVGDQTHTATHRAGGKNIAVKLR